MYGGMRFRGGEEEDAADPRILPQNNLSRGRRVDVSKRYHFEKRTELEVSG
jgi:hypothetical protein